MLQLLSEICSYCHTSCGRTKLTAVEFIRGIDDNVELHTIWILFNKIQYTL